MALCEAGLDLLHCRLQGAVVLRPAYGPLDIIGRFADPSEDAAKKSTGRAQQVTGLVKPVRLITRHIPIAAAVTVELELVSLVC